MNSTSPHARDPGNATATSLITLKDGIPTTTSLAIAEGTGTQHKNVLELIRTYKTDLETFGRVAFETRPFETPGGQQKQEFAHLNEPQSTLILTYMKNTAVIRAFKIRLVKAFYEMAEVTRASAPSSPPNPIHGKASRIVLADQVAQLARLTAAIEAMATPIDMPTLVETLTKNVFPAILRPMVEELVSARIQSDPRIAVESMVSARQILDEEKVPSKNRGGLVVSASHSLPDYCILNGLTPKRCARTRTWLFPVGVKEAWLKAAGRKLIDDHHAAIYGQRKFDLVPMPEVLQAEAKS